MCKEFEELLAVAVSMAECGKPEGAIQYLSEKNSEWWECQTTKKRSELSLAFDYLAGGYFGLAWEKLKKNHYDEINPRKFWKARGRILYDNGDYQQAESCLSRLVNKKDSAEVAGMRGVCLYRLSKYGPALPFLNQAIRQNDPPGTYWVFLGLTQYELGNPEKALESFGKAEQLGCLTDEALEAQKRLRARKTTA